MTSAQHLDALREQMPPGVFRDASRLMLKGFSAADLVEWERLQNARRVREHRAKRNGSEDKPTITPEPFGNASPEGAAITEGQNSNGCGQEAPITKEERFHTSKEETEEKEKPLRGKKKESADIRPEDVPLPDALAALPVFPAAWANFIESRRLIREPMTHLAASLRLKKLAERPADAVAAVELCIENRWQGFEWRWFDKDRAPLNGHANGATLHTGRPRAPDDPRAQHDPADFLRWLHAMYPRTKANPNLTLHSADTDTLAEYVRSRQPR